VGCNVVVPLTPKLDWEAIWRIREMGRRAVRQGVSGSVHVQHGEGARTGRILSITLRNGAGDSGLALIGRARPGATVATPLFWDEVEKGVTPDAFTVVTVPARLRKIKADPWAEMAKLRQSIGARVRREIGI
jgi:bifunctional non-homologous end joining protein LigD